MLKSKFCKILLVFIMVFNMFPTSSWQVTNATEENEITSVNNESYEDDIPEITDEKTLNKGARGKVNNYDDVCRGGGHPGQDDGNKNTNRPNQDPEERNPLTNKYYWAYDDSNNPFQEKYSEQRLIDKIWPKTGRIPSEHSYRLKDAVIDPEDKCYYANAENGYGESFGNNIGNERAYFKYNHRWENEDKKTHTPAPAGSSTENGSSIKPPTYTDLSYLGNYRWRQQGTHRNGSWLFTIVSRPKLWMGSASYYYDKNTQENIPQFYIDGDSHPRVYDNSTDIQELVNLTEAMFKFEGYNGTRNTFYSMPGKKGFNDSTNYRKSPTEPGFYDVTIQTSPKAEKFMLPGVYRTKAVYMRKGYTSRFVSQIDNTSEQEVEWNQGNDPQGFDSDTKRLFDIDLYPEGGSYDIPIPKYDENKYIFEGWEVVEQYWKKPSIGYPRGQIKTETRTLTKEGEAYKYIPRTIDSDQYFVLEAKFVAKLRSKKTQTINVETQVVGGEKISQALVVDPSSITIKEQEQSNIDTFNARVQAGYAYDFFGWSYSKEGEHNDLSTQNTYKPEADFNTQSKTIYATYKPKKYSITFNANGGVNSNGQGTTTSQEATYYNNVRLDKNPFIRDGYVFKGWSTAKSNNTVKYADQANVRNLPLNGLDNSINADIPQDITLYAVWEREISDVTISKHKDTLWIPRENIWQSTAGNVFVTPPGNITVSTSYSVYEITRFYLDVDMSGLGISVKDLDKSKFFVVWERSTDGGKTYHKLPLNSYSSFFTVPFTQDKQYGSGKVVFDSEKNKWFAPLIVRATYPDTQDGIGGLYRVSVAYDDPTATVRVATEEQFYNGKSEVGWKTSEPTEVNVVQSFDTVVTVPKSITLSEKDESDPTGQKEVIESVRRSNKVTVNKIKHSYTNEEDTNWHTPSNALEGYRDNRDDSYNGINGLHNEYIIQKSYAVSISWNGQLRDTSKQYLISNIDMYSARNIGSMKENEKISNGTKAEFILDGSVDDKVLFDFYLKGDKPKELPDGMRFKGTLTFRITNKG